MKTFIAASLLALSIAQPCLAADKASREHDLEVSRYMEERRLEWEQQEYIAEVKMYGTYATYLCHAKAAAASRSLEDTVLQFCLSANKGR